MNSTVTSNQTGSGYQPILWVVDVLSYSISGIGIVTNALIMFLFARYKRLQKRHELTHLIVLAAFDFWRCACSPLYNLIKAAQWFLQLTRASFLAVSLVLMYSTEFSQRQLLWIAIDRLYAIKKPHNYRNYSHRRRAAIVVCVLLALPVPETVYAYSQLKEPFRTDQAYELNDVLSLGFILQLTAGNIIVAALMSITNAALWQSKTSSRYSHHKLSQNKQPSKTASKPQEERERKRQAKLNKLVISTTLFCIFAFVVPLIVYTVVMASDPTYAQMHLAERFVSTMTILNSAVNFFIYAISYDDFKECLKMFFGLDKENVVVPASTN